MTLSFTQSFKGYLKRKFRTCHQEGACIQSKSTVVFLWHNVYWMYLKVIFGSHFGSHNCSNHFSIQYSTYRKLCIEEVYNALCPGKTDTSVSQKLITLKLNIQTRLLFHCFLTMSLIVYITGGGMSKPISLSFICECEQGSGSGIRTIIQFDCF